MARPGLFAHRKFRRLARMLGGEVLALGHLEFLWSAAYDIADDFIGDATDVAAAAHWGDDEAHLTQALMSCGGSGHAGFIEELESRPGHYKVHDLWDHAPEYVKKRRSRELSRREDGSRLINDGRQPADHGGRVADRGGRPDASVSGQPVSEQGRGTTTLIPPTPRDEPVGHPDPTRGQKASITRQWAQAFELFWAKFPRKVAKQDAEKAWLKLAPESPSLIEARLGGIAMVLQERVRVDWNGRPRDKLPYPATFLNRERFPLQEAQSA